MSNVNSIEVHFVINGIEYIVTGCYRSPLDNIDAFLSSLYSYLTQSSEYKNHIICGDFNIDILKSINLKVIEYLNIFYGFGFYSCINNVTRQTNTTASCIDHFFVKRILPVNIHSYVYLSSITDHFSIILTFNLNFNHLQHSKRNYTNNVLPVIDFDKLNLSINNFNWDIILSSNDIDVDVTNFINKIDLCIANSTKKISRKFNSYNYKLKPWITKGIIVSIRHREKMYGQKIKNPNNITLITKYNKFRNLLNTLIKKAKSMYYHNKIYNNKGNVKKLWETIKYVTNNSSNNSKNTVHSLINNEGIKISDNKIIPNIFNDYFSSVGMNIYDKILNKNYFNDNFHDLNKGCYIYESIFFTPITHDEIIKFIQKIKDYSSFYEGNLSNKVLKMTSTSISKPLAIIFNKIVELGIFPLAFKKAVVIPIFKSGDKGLPENYRPISLTLSISKLLEKCIKVRLVNFLNKYKFFSDRQFGFREGMSTNDALFHITNYIYDNIDKSNYVIGVFLDIKKAFDTVSLDLLIRKLHYAGIRGNILKLIKSYLNDRTQIVRVNNEYSYVSNISIGVPQGSVLGPLLFNIYVNGLLNVSIKGNIYSFADDTVMLFNNKSIEVLFDEVNLSLDSVQNWYDNNFLELNLKKSNYILFNLRPNSINLNNLIICPHSLNCKNKIVPCNCQHIQRVKHIKYLGLIFDDKLKWNFHIDKLVNTIRNLFYNFKSLKYVLDIKHLRIIYMSLVQSLVYYGLPFWGGTYKDYLTSLNTTINSLIKCIISKPFLYPTKQLYIDFNVQPISILYYKSLLLLIYKYRHCLKTIEHNYNTRNKSHSNLNSIMFYKTVTSQSAIYKCTLLCRKLNLNLMHFNNINSLKLYIKLNQFDNVTLNYEL